MSKAAIIMLCLVLVALLGGPLIFYGLVALGEAGAFDNALGNFWVIVSAGFGLVAIIWFAILFIGSRALAADRAKEQLNG